MNTESEMPGLISSFHKSINRPTHPRTDISPRRDALVWNFALVSSFQLKKMHLVFEFYLWMNIFDAINEIILIIREIQ